VLALCAAVSAACSAASAPSVALDSVDPHRPIVTVTGLSRRDASTLSHVTLSREAWTSILRVSVKTDAGPAPLPVAGRYDITNGVIRFIPLLPFEAGRSYEVAFNPAALPGGGLSHLRPITRAVSVPAPAATTPTSVAAVYPTGPEVPENLLRMYVEFSAPMGIRTGERYISILDGEGQEITGALLPLDTDLWNGAHTRFTILFDPGRVKRGILPNRASGRPLNAGGTFTVLVRRDWPDAHDRPLSADFRKTYRVGPPIERALTAADWQIAPPSGGTRDPLVVRFRSPLDRGLLQRAIAVTRGDRAVDGDASVHGAETEWRFVPRAPWPRGAHALSALPELEDPAGNRVGHAFETRDPADDTRRPPTRVPFEIR
jgi:hypothetical protein